jgi:hypothetical protein
MAFSVHFIRAILRRQHVVSIRRLGSWFSCSSLMLCMLLELIIVL